MPITEMTFLTTSGGQGEPAMTPTVQKHIEEQHLLQEKQSDYGNILR